MVRHIRSHRQFHTLPNLLDSRAALSNSYRNTCVHCREAVCPIVLMVFGVTRSTTYRVRGGHAILTTKPTRYGILDDNPIITIIDNISYYGTNGKGYSGHVIGLRRSQKCNQRHRGKQGTLSSSLIIHCNRTHLQRRIMLIVRQVNVYKLNITLIMRIIIFNNIKLYFLASFCNKYELVKLENFYL